MWFKKKVRNRIYKQYLDGIDIASIHNLNRKLSVDDINEIIDYMNMFYA